MGFAPSLWLFRGSFHLCRTRGPERCLLLAEVKGLAGAAVDRRFSSSQDFPCLQSPSSPWGLSWPLWSRENGLSSVITNRRNN